MQTHLLCPALASFFSETGKVKEGKGAPPTDRKGGEKWGVCVCVGGMGEWYRSLSLVVLSDVSMRADTLLSFPPHTPRRRGGGAVCEERKREGMEEVRVVMKAQEMTQEGGGVEGS